MSADSLSKEDHQFFYTLAAVVMGNPFSEVPAEIAEEVLAPEGPDGAHRHDRYVPVLLPAVTDRLAHLDRNGSLRLDEMSDADREVFFAAILFHGYASHIDELDALIEAQERRGEEPVDVDFARPLLRQIEARGITAERADYYLALYYQLRRAFYFIARSLVGESPSMRALRCELWNSAFSRHIRIYDLYLCDHMEDFSTLIIGETGTGKGAAAAALGRAGFIPFDRRRNRFESSFTSLVTAINLSQYPEALIESELFGHRRGAFTGAIDEHKGMLEATQPNGTLFLDEIGEVSVPVQIKLLQVLQDRTFRPVGSQDLKRFDGRVVAATNQRMDTLRTSGAFRDDFYYRLCSNVIEVPSLRARIHEDSAELERLVRLLALRIIGADDDRLIDAVVGALKGDLDPAYPWPGNVRELEQAVRRILLTGHYFGDRPRHALDSEQALLEDVRAGALTKDALLARYCALLYSRFGTYEAVAQRAGLDRRTAKRYVEAGAEPGA